MEEWKSGNGGFLDDLVYKINHIIINSDEPNKTGLEIKTHSQAGSILISAGGGTTWKLPFWNY